MKKLLPVAQIVDRFNRQALALKNAGAFEQSDTWKAAVLLILRMADAEEESIEPPSEDS